MLSDPVDELVWDERALVAGRELTEETCYVATKLEKLTSFYPTPGFCTEFQTTWLATGLTLANGTKKSGSKAWCISSSTPPHAMAPSRRTHIAIW